MLDSTGLANLSPKTEYIKNQCPRVHNLTSMFTDTECSIFLGIYCVIANLSPGLSELGTNVVEYASPLVRSLILSPPFPRPS